MSTPDGTTVPGPDLAPRVKPRLRGVSHQIAFFVCLAAVPVLVVLASGQRATVAALIYGIGLCGLFGTSALYHRHNWDSARARAWMRRLDHSMIFVLIAATYTPFALLVFEGSFATAVLIVVWAGGLAGVVLSLVWVSAPKWVLAAVTIALGWVAVATMPQLLDHAGPGGLSLIASGGVLYTAGAVVYARRRPDPRPAVFGYHEIFHLLVIAAAITHFVAVAVYALPSG